VLTLGSLPGSGWLHVGRDSSVVSEDSGCRAWRDSSRENYKVVALRTTLSPAPRTYVDLALRGRRLSPRDPATLRLGASDIGREHIATVYMYMHS